MIGKYLGHLSQEDPLYAYMREEIIPQFGLHIQDVDFRVFQPPNSHHVYVYEERQSGMRVVGKFHPPSSKSTLEPISSGQIEYNNLVFLRSLGFDEPPHYVVRPLGFNRDLGNALIVEYRSDDLLGNIITDAIHFGKTERLYRKLSSLGNFLASFHNHTAASWRVNFDISHAYMRRLISSLVVKRGLEKEFSEELDYLCDVWRTRDFMWEDCSVLVHGDVTPSNILAGSWFNITIIDLEWMQWSDRVFDIGRLCGELMHYFLQGTGDRVAAEPFIGHFLWHYCSSFPDQIRAFKSVTQRAPFYMALNLLRIARNSWINRDYRRKLVLEAKKILRATL
ncbi:MAG: phosphotransferase [Syntrophaceae bacterium]|nr:phosphotransferase [Syntrophaceae bacterium]